MYISQATAYLKQWRCRRLQQPIDSDSYPPGIMVYCAKRFKFDKWTNKNIKRLLKATKMELLWECKHLFLHIESSLQIYIRGVIKLDQQKITLLHVWQTPSTHNHIHNIFFYVQGYTLSHGPCDLICGESGYILQLFLLLLHGHNERHSQLIAFARCMCFPNPCMR